MKFLNDAPSMADDAFVEKADEYESSLDRDWIWERLGERAKQGDSHYAFLREFRLSDGKLDPRPIRLADINLIRRLNNRATYQFTLERYSYHAADYEGCNGLFTHDEYYGIVRTSCLATFFANNLATVRLFPEWFLA